jgi:hypothetical protein
VPARQTVSSLTFLLYDILLTTDEEVSAWSSFVRDRSIFYLQGTVNMAKTMDIHEIFVFLSQVFLCNCTTVRALFPLIPNIKIGQQHSSRILSASFRRLFSIKPCHWPPAVLSTHVPRLADLSEYCGFVFDYRSRCGVDHER